MPPFWRRFVKKAQLMLLENGPLSFANLLTWIATTALSGKFHCHSNLAVKYPSSHFFSFVYCCWRDHLRSKSFCYYNHHFTLLVAVLPPTTFLSLPRTHQNKRQPNSQEFFWSPDDSHLRRSIFRLAMENTTNNCTIKAHDDIKLPSIMVGLVALDLVRTTFNTVRHRDSRQYHSG